MNRRLAFAGGLLAVLAAVVVVLGVADLSPRVENDFFFSTDDPQMQASRRIGELFPTGEQVLISATAADLMAEDFLARLRSLSDALAGLEGVASVRSLTHGPTTPQSVAKSPLWSRLLLGEDPRRTLVIVTLEQGGEAADGSGETQRRALVERVEAVISEHDRASFALDVSGVPYVVEQIRRALGRDLRLFSLASLAVFALVIAIVYRSLWVVVGTLVTCTGACAVTLALLWGIGAPIGLLTANIVTIVFVLTLSHLVFLTANWWRAGDADEGAGVAVDRSVRLTAAASVGCALTTLLGFASLLLASAKPLRELGQAGALGTLVALTLAYALYPSFLSLATPPRRGAASGAVGEARLRRLRAPVTAVLAVAVVVAAFGVPKLDTDPGLLSYFDAHGELRRGLERIDRNGGSSPLLLVVEDEGKRLDTPEAQVKMGELQKALDADPDASTVLSLPVLLDEAKQVPMAFLLGPERLVSLLDSARFEHVARGFITEDRTHALFFVRMREAERGEPRGAIIDRQLAEVRKAGLTVAQVGGLYPLQASLGELVGSSLARGLGGLLGLFVLVAAWAARGVRVTAAMMACLAAVPILVIGVFSHLELPLDIISSPAANVAIALGIDSMIHLVSAVRRRRQAGDGAEAAWSGALAGLWPAILGAATILAAGFGIFSLSSFPPTRRFGLAVALGTAAAAALTVLVLPLLAGPRHGDEL